MVQDMSEKKLRRNRLEILRDEMVMKDRILALLAGGGRTIREIAASLEYPDDEVTLWIMAMVRYGTLDEVPKGRGDDYYQYTIAE